MLCRRESWRFGNLSIGYFHPMDLTLRLKPCTGRWYRTKCRRIRPRIAEMRRHAGRPDEVGLAALQAV